MKRAVLIVFSLAVIMLLHAQNLVVNPGFETWDRTNKPSGWIHAERCLKDSTSFFSGEYSCLHAGGATTTSDLGQTITVSPMKDYTLSLQYKTVITASGNGARIWCYWKDASGNSISDPSTDDILRPSKYMKSDTWDRLTISITSPPEAAAFYLEVRTYPNSLAYWDDFVLEENITTRYMERKETNINVFPNPASDYLIINNLINVQSADIKSLTGISLWSSTYNGENIVTIPVSHLPDGAYILRIFTTDLVITRKFIKMAR